MRRGLCALAVVCMLLTACAGPAEAPQTMEPVPDETIPEETELLLETPEVLGHREGELVFSMTASEFAAGFNSVWGGAYLSPVEEWESYSIEQGIHSPHETLCYQFSENEKVWSLPTITVCTPADSQQIQQITVKFDEHSRTEELYDLYGELCQTAVAVFLPEVDGETLCSRVNELAYENVFENQDGYSPDSRIPVIFHSGGVGIYPYFALGEWVHFVIIPLNGERLAELEAEGTEVLEIQ